MSLALKVPLSYTVEDAVEKAGFGKYQVKLLFILGTFFLADACEMLLLSVLSSALMCTWMLSKTKVAFITTVVFIGMTIFASVWGKCADLYGRKKILFIVASLSCYFGILTAFSPTYTWVLILRFLVGAGIAGSSQAFTLLLEFLPMAYRAKTLVAYMCFWAVGSMFEIVVAGLTLPTLGWTYLVGFTALPLLAVLPALFFVPESPRYCLAAGHQKEAEKSITKLLLENNKIVPEGRLQKASQTSVGNIFELFSGQVGRTTLHLWIIWFITTLSYYGSVLMTSEILSLDNACLIDKRNEISQNSCPCEKTTFQHFTPMMISTAGELAGLIISYIGLDLIGRKNTIAVNLGMSCVFFILLLFCNEKTALTTFLFIIRAFLNSGMASNYVYTGEAYPTTVRAFGIGTCSSAGRIGAMVTPYLAQVLIEKSFPATIGIYAALCVFGSINALLLPIETKGRELKTSEDVEKSS